MREQYNKWSFCSQSATTHRVYRCLDKFTPFSGAASPEVRCLADRNLHCCCGVKECIFLRKLSADNHFLIPTTYRSERSLHSLRDDGEKSLTLEFICLGTISCICDSASEPAKRHKSCAPEFFRSDLFFKRAFALLPPIRYCGVGLSSGHRK